MSSATGLERCVYDVPGVGVVHEIRDSWYDDGLAALAEDGASFLDYTARNSAYARRRVPLEHDLNARGNWVAAEIAFGLPGLERPLLVLGPGPVYANPRHARRAYEEGRELDLRQPALELPAEMMQWGDSWDVALARLCRADRQLLARGDASPGELRVLELPHVENFFIESEELAALDEDALDDAERFAALPPPLRVAALVFGDQGPGYARDVLLPATVLNLLVMLPAPRAPHPYAQPLWFGSVTPGCGSCLVGCVCGSWIRGLAPGAEATRVSGGPGSAGREPRTPGR
jgi:hypothetical protein